MSNVYSVGQINTYIKNMFVQDFLLSAVSIRGEVSNCKYHSSGHIYFTLKDASGTLACIMFAGRRRGGLLFEMKEGDQIVAEGSVSVYERDGRYQMYCDRIRRDGVGLLNEKYEELKRKLEEQGLFDECYKQPVPRYIRTLGVVTAPTGAAVQDIINIATRRNPYVQIILYPAVVQGDKAPESIVRGIRELERQGVDVMIIGRGGGSLEDLWAFNDERVAQAVFECSIPIISAVGHETDTVITDYVADLRAPTPSAGAELAVYDYAAFLEETRGYKAALENVMRHQLQLKREQIRNRMSRFGAFAPAIRIRENRMRILNSKTLLERFLQQKIREGRQQAAVSEERFQSGMEYRLQRDRHRLQLLAAGLHGLSPLDRLSGGYSYAADLNGAALRGIDQIDRGDLFTVQFADGKIKARVEEKWQIKLKK